MASKAQDQSGKRRTESGRNGANRGGSTDSAARPRRVEATRQSLAGILTLVLAGHASTRHELERRTGLGRAMVADRLSTLIDLSLLDESQLGEAKGGRAPRLIQFRADRGLVLVAFLDKSMLSVGVADLTGRLMIEHHEAIDLADGPAATLERLITLFDWVLEQHQADREIWGIGIAVPGPVEPSNNEPFASPAFHSLPMWHDHPLVEHLIARYNAPVWVRSNVECMTLGEHEAGGAQGSDSLLFVKLGRGVSAALFVNGHLLRGALGGGGQIGHVVVDEDSAVVCHCGKVGCLEVMAGGDAIARQGVAGAQAGKSTELAETLKSTGTITANDVGIAAQLGDTFSAELLVRSGRLIGNALSAAVNLVNPAVVVVGGDVAQTGDLLLSAIRQAVYRHAHPLTTRDLRIIKSQMGSSAGLLGAATVVVDAEFATHELEQWVAFGSPLRHPDFAAQVAAAASRVGTRRARPVPPPAGRAPLARGRA